MALFELQWIQPVTPSSSYEEVNHSLCTHSSSYVIKTFRQWSRVRHSVSKTRCRCWTCLWRWRGRRQSTHHWMTISLPPSCEAVWHSPLSPHHIMYAVSSTVSSSQSCSCSARSAMLWAWQCCQHELAATRDSCVDLVVPSSNRLKDLPSSVWQRLPCRTFSSVWWESRPCLNPHVAAPASWECFYSTTVSTEFLFTICSSSRAPGLQCPSHLNGSLPSASHSEHDGTSRYVRTYYTQ